MGAPDISDEVQVATVLPMLPPGATHEVIADSDEGQHNSGRTDRRTGFQDLIARIEAGSCDGVAVYELGRLARNARLLLNLHHAMEGQGVPLVVGVMPNTRFDTAIGRYMLGQLALATQLQADFDSERMSRLCRTLFEDGRHRGGDPFGYTSTRDSELRRHLVVVPAEAEVVQRIWGELPRRSFDDIARGLNRDGVHHRSARLWTRDAVKDIVRRGRVYAGFVVEKRGLHERPGRHEPILDEATYEAGMAGVASRRGATLRRAPTRRVYLLAGILHCSCGTRMRGQTVVSRRREWRYYQCPNAARHIRDEKDQLICDARSVPGDDAEQAVLNAIAELRLPQRVIDKARSELARRLNVPDGDRSEVQRSRLERKLLQLRKQHGWGDLSDAEYRAEVAETRAALAQLPDHDKLVAFDRHRAIVTTLAESIPSLTPESRRQLIRLLVEYVEARDRAVVRDGIVWTAPVRPFFASTDSFAMAPPDGRRGAGVKADYDALAWYAMATG